MADSVNRSVLQSPIHSEVKGGQILVLCEACPNTFP